MIREGSKGLFPKTIHLMTLMDMINYITSSYDRARVRYIKRPPVVLWCLLYEYNSF